MQRKQSPRLYRVEVEKVQVSRVQVVKFAERRRETSSAPVQEGKGSLDKSTDFLFQFVFDA